VNAWATEDATARLYVPASQPYGYGRGGEKPGFPAMGYGRPGWMGPPPPMGPQQQRPMWPPGFRPQAWGPVVPEDDGRPVIPPNYGPPSIPPHIPGPMQGGGPPGSYWPAPGPYWSGPPPAVWMPPPPSPQEGNWSPVVPSSVSSETARSLSPQIVFSLDPSGSVDGLADFAEQKNVLPPEVPQSGSQDGAPSASVRPANVSSPSDPISMGGEMGPEPPRWRTTTHITDKVDPFETGSQGACIHLILHLLSSPPHRCTGRRLASNAHSISIGSALAASCRS
jgi:hypothetical protein